MTQYDYEKKHLERILSVIRERKKSLKERKKALENNINELNTNFNNDSSWIIHFDEGNAVDSTQGLINIKSKSEEIMRIDKALKKYEILLSKPYFGKITINNSEDIYIGNSTLKTVDEDILIYDWRTPIASVFYENKLGEVSYKINKREEIKTNVTSRIQFIIEYGELIDIIDNESYIGDPNLIDRLKENKTNKLADVVSTIQKEQNKVIRQPLTQDSVVYGPPGSGKTTIAIQRMAYLLYRYRNNISNEELMLFLPNELFNDYISDALPELGEENVRYNTFNRFISNLSYFKNKRKESFTNCIQRMNSRIKDIEFYQQKSSLGFLKMINNGIDMLTNKGLKFNNFEYNGITLVSKEKMEEIFYLDVKYPSIKKRINLVREYLINIYNKEIRKLVKLKYKELDAIGNYIGEKNELIETAKSYAKSMLKPLRILIKTYRFVDIYTTYSNMVENSVYQQKVNFEEEILFDDLPPLVLILLHLVNLKDNNIKHIIIDEIQDYSNLQFQVLKLFYPNSTFTLLGDRNQTLFPKKLSKIEETNFNKLILKNSYRSTNQINKYLEDLIPSNLISMGREGKSVTKINRKDLCKEDLTNILQKSEGRIAVIVSSVEILSIIKEFNFSGFKLVKDEDTLYHNKNIILPYYLAKGFEYETVISIEYGDIKNKHIKYIIGSRAIKKLYILNIG